jgi:ABC-2 type transport system permease protein
MHKLFAVLKREYIQAVRKKMFIIMTILLPALLAGLFVVPSLVMVRGLGKKQVVVIDGTGRLEQAFKHAAEAIAVPEAPKLGRRTELPGSLDVTYVPRPGDTKLDATAKPYLDRLGEESKEKRLDGVFVIPANAFESSKEHMKFYSRSSTDFISEQRLGNMANHEIQRKRLDARGIAAEEIEKLLTDTPVDSVQVSKSGEQKKGGEANLFIGLIFTGLLMLPSFIYGLEIMRGIIQEKNDRVVEVLISSMTPGQLLTGKIVGIALVGLTQVTVWLLMLVAVGTFGAVAIMSAGFDISQVLHASTFVYFVIFFILAYLTYVCVYAVGGAICNSDKEAQQLIAPITMTMMLPWFLIVVLITNPDSPLVVGLSMAPVFGPLTMFVRILVAEPPISQILITIAVSIATVVAFFWATAKIFRVGILSYGKRPTIPELWRWMKVA